MLKNQSKLIKKVAITIGVLFLIYFGLNWLAQRKALSLIDDSLPDHVELNYAKLKVNVLLRSARFEDVSLNLLDSIHNEVIGSFRIQELEAKQFGLFDYLFNNSLSLNYVAISRGDGSLRISENKVNDSINFIQRMRLAGVHFKKIDLNQLSLRLISAENDSIIAFVRDLSLEMNDLNANKRDDDLQLFYKNYSITTGSIGVQLDPLNTFTINTITGNDKETTLSDISLQTKYDIPTFSKNIQHERDHYDIKINSLRATKLPRSFNYNDNYIQIGGLDIEQPNAFIFRDKTHKDDLRIKPMLGEIFRNIPINFNVEKFYINNALITYKERTHLYNDGGLITIDNIIVDVDDLSNVAANQPISMQVAANYGGTATMKAQWDFDALNENDEFVFRSEVENIDLSALNGFSKPNFNTEMEGHIDQLFYTISGDKYNSEIDIKSKHDNVKVTVFKKDQKSRNKFFTSVANLMISNDSESKKSDYITEHESVERDRTKSVFNFLCKNVREGMMKVFL